MTQDRNARRWLYVLEGDVAIAPVYDADGDVMYILVEAGERVWKCRTPHDVDAAIDCAIHLKNFYEPPSIH